MPYAKNWNESNYGELTQIEADVRKLLKNDFPELKEKQIKDLLDSKLWLAQRDLMNHATRLKAEVAQANRDNPLMDENGQWHDFNAFDLAFKGAQKSAGVKLDAKQSKQILDAISWKNPAAAPVVKKAIKESAQPLYGAFEYQGDIAAYQGKVVEYVQDGDLRDNENVPLNPAVSTSDLIESYFLERSCPTRCRCVDQCR